MKHGTKKFKAVFILILFVGIFALAKSSKAATIYLDGDLSSNCAGNYSILNRNCTGSDGNAYNTIAGANSALAGGDTLYMRQGAYYRTGSNSYTGALNITTSGTSQAHTVVSNYNNETVWIGTAADKLQYPPAPYDSNYYASAAVSIKADYVDVIGIKTYGMFLIIGESSQIHDILVNNCDVGGGGPYLNQAFALLIHTAYNVTVQNSLLHNSGQSDGGGAPNLGCYACQAIVRNNYFYNGYCGDITVKDTGGQSGRNWEINNNFFMHSDIASSECDRGIIGLNQAASIQDILIHNNIFFGKTDGAIIPELKPTGNFSIYNNTFINNAHDIYFWASGPYVSRNNFYYHTSLGSNFVNMGYTTDANIDSDYNCYYSSGVSPYWRSSTISTTNFSVWQASHDANGVNGIDPNFLNPTGNSAEDFKRSSYPNDVPEGSPYGRVCGAYLNGSEVIGTNTGSSDSTPPSAPSGLSVS